MREGSRVAPKELPSLGDSMNGQHSVTTDRLLKHMGALALAAVVGLALPGNVTASTSPGDDDEPTYSKEVSRILQANCQICHQPGQIGPMSLVTYQDARRYSRRIRDLVAAREMPPYHYDADIGIQELQGDWRMTEEEIETIVAWVDAIFGR